VRGPAFRFRLNDRTSSSCGQMNHQQDDADDEENPGDLRGDRSDAGRAKNARNQSDDEKHQSVIQHGCTSLSVRDIAEGVPFWFAFADQALKRTVVMRDVADRCKPDGGCQVITFVARFSNLLLQEAKCQDQDLKISPAQNMPTYNVIPWMKFEIFSRRPIPERPDIVSPTAIGLWGKPTGAGDTSTRSSTKISRRRRPRITKPTKPSVCNIREGGPTLARPFLPGDDPSPIITSLTPTFEPSPLAPRRTPEEEARDRDLGFGSVVSRESRKRLLNRDGTFNVLRSGMGWLETFAPHELLQISWLKFIGVLVGVYLVLNVIFALLFVLFGPRDLAGPGMEMLGGRMSQAFFFSIQTFATIGYGQIGPNGMAANLIVTVEALVGMMYQALATGLLFVRFARPRADILFSRLAVIAPYNDGVSLQFRIANLRRNEIIELEAEVLYSAMEPDSRGGVVRRYTRLPLERNRVVFFPLAWTIVHPIDAASPLQGKTRREMADKNAEILVLLSGIDETFEQTVHARSSYTADEIAWNARFSSMYLPADGDVRVDLKRLHEVEAIK
jgi:inward rectifier potassium channel